MGSVASPLQKKFKKKKRKKKRRSSLGGCKMRRKVQDGCNTLVGRGCVGRYVVEMTFGVLRFAFEHTSGGMWEWLAGCCLCMITINSFRRASVPHSRSSWQWPSSQQASKKAS